MTWAEDSAKDTSNFTLNRGRAGSDTLWLTQIDGLALKVEVFLSEQGGCPQGRAPPTLTSQPLMSYLE